MTKVGWTRGADFLFVLLARVGVMIVLPETKVAGANRVAHKLRQCYVQSAVETHAGPVSFTASVGVTAVEAAHEFENVSKIEHLLRAADRGLYASKKLGGNHATASGVIASKLKVRTKTGGSNGIN